MKFAVLGNQNGGGGRRKKEGKLERKRENSAIPKGKTEDRKQGIYPEYDQAYRARSFHQAAPRACVPARTSLTQIRYIYIYPRAWQMDAWVRGSGAGPRGVPGGALTARHRLPCLPGRRARAALGTTCSPLKGRHRFRPNLFDLIICVSGCRVG